MSESGRRAFQSAGAASVISLVDLSNKLGGFEKQQKGLLLEHIRELGIGVRFGFGGGMGEVGTGQCSALVQFYII